MTNAPWRETVTFCPTTRRRSRFGIYAGLQIRIVPANDAWRVAPLLSPLRDVGAEQAIERCLGDGVTLARARLQGLSVEDRDRATPIADDAGALQYAGRLRDASA